LRLIEEVVEIAGAETRTIVRVGDRTYEAAYSSVDYSTLRGICAPTGQACEFSPGWVNFRFPVEKGNSWSFTSTVRGETYVCEDVVEATVDGIETINTPAGQFAAYRLSGTQRNRCGQWRGTARFTSWVASINGKAVVLKYDYGNSFGDTATLELVSAELK
jgi:hypothetical protein